MIVASMVLVIFGAFNILKGVSVYLEKSDKLALHATVDQVTWMEWMFILVLIFLGSVSYTLASYYHLKIHNWSFLTAFLIALPLVLIEYQFSIRGNHAAKHVLKLNAVQITLITMVFYFINSWLLNHFVLKQKVVLWREVLAFAFVLAAFVLATNGNS
jgi:uncharacterized protein (DUF486 family)